MRMEQTAVAKYDEWITEDGIIKIQGYARDGMTDTEMADKMGISRSTLNAWKKKYPSIATAIKGGKEVPDRKVETSLFDRCIGITVTLRKPIKIKETIYDPVTGKKKTEKERIEYIEEESYIPPDTKAIIFWLTNRKPDVWRTRIEVGQREEEAISGAIEIESRIREIDVDAEIKKENKEL